MDKKMLIFSAPSGSGKSTIINYLLDKGYPLEFSISATTRSPRGAEKHGVEYYFLSVDEFKKKIAENEFVEYEEVYQDRFYGTLKSELERIWANGKTIVFDVDVVGGVRLKEIFGNSALAIFIKLPSLVVLEKRLRNRQTDSEEEITKRLAKAEKELQYAEKFDVEIINDKLEDAYSEAEHILQKFLV